MASKQRGFAVVDVAEDNDNGGAGRHIFGVGAGLNVVLCAGADGDIPTELGGERENDVVGEWLGLRSHFAARQQFRDDVGCAYAQIFGEFLDTGAGSDRNCVRCGGLGGDERRQLLRAAAPPGAFARAWLTTASAGRWRTGGLRVDNYATEACAEWGILFLGGVVRRARVGMLFGGVLLGPPVLSLWLCGHLTCLTIAPGASSDRGFPGNDFLGCREPSDCLARCTLTSPPYSVRHGTGRGLVELPGKHRPGRPEHHCHVAPVL